MSSNLFITPDLEFAYLYLTSCEFYNLATIPMTFVFS